MGACPGFSAEWRLGLPGTVYISHSLGSKRCQPSGATGVRVIEVCLCMVTRPKGYCTVTFSLMVVIPL